MGVYRMSLITPVFFNYRVWLSYYIPVEISYGNVVQKNNFIIFHRNMCENLSKLLVLFYILK